VRDYAANVGYVKAGSVKSIIAGAVRLERSQPASFKAAMLALL